MVATTEQEKDEWIGQVGKAIVKNSGMYVEDQMNNGELEDDISDDSEDESKS